MNVDVVALPLYKKISMSPLSLNSSERVSQSVPDVGIHKVLPISLSLALEINSTCA